MPRSVKKRCGQCGVRPGRLVHKGEDLGTGRRLCLVCLPEIAPALVRFQHDREKTDRSLEGQYGISVKEYEARAVRQGGRCAICRQRPEVDRRLAVDHDHETGAVRGLLCSNCNLMLGNARDNVATLGRAVAYLADHAAKPPR